MALESTEDAIEAALFNPESAFKGLNHLPIGMRVFEMQIERGRISDTGPFKSSIAAPEFHAALEVRVENSHAILSPRPWMEPGFSPRLTYYRRENKGEVGVWGECNGCHRKIELARRLVLIKRQESNGSAPLP